MFHREKKTIHVSFPDPSSVDDDEKDQIDELWTIRYSSYAWFDNQIEKKGEHLIVKQFDNFLR